MFSLGFALRMSMKQKIALFAITLFRYLEPQNWG